MVELDFEVLSLFNTATADHAIKRIISIGCKSVRITCFIYNLIIMMPFICYGIGRIILYLNHTIGSFTRSNRYCFIEISKNFKLSFFQKLEMNSICCLLLKILTCHKVIRFPSFQILLKTEVTFITTLIIIL